MAAKDPMAFEQASTKEDGITSQLEDPLTRAAYRKLVHKIDRRLITTCGFMYCVSLVDRTNLGSANIAGMSKDLELTVGYRYLPATVACRKIGAKVFLPGITLAWGFLLDGLGGLEGWRWIFLMEGLITVVVATICYFTIVDFPDRAHNKSKFLTKEECEIVMDKINADRSDADEEAWDFRKLIASGKDPLIYGYALIFFGLTAITYAVAYFLPMILRDQMGFSLAASQCLIAPPYFVACLYMFATAWISDKYRIRGPVMMFNSVVGIAGLALMGFASNSGAAYFGVFLICCGFNTNIPACMTYQPRRARIALPHPLRRPSTLLGPPHLHRPVPLHANLSPVNSHDLPLPLERKAPHAARPAEEEGRAALARPARPVRAQRAEVPRREQRKVVRRRRGPHVQQPGLVADGAVAAVDARLVGWGAALRGRHGVGG
ncbi:major facilitator superfamily domain-containing protein [Verticillium dahliae]|nr:major facilitator superfamily domain-containing protein [Verticillium dahliae]